MKTLEQLNGVIEFLREDEIINLEGGYVQPTNKELGIREEDANKLITTLKLIITNVAH